ncbi:PilZ domain-containing protein [Candidatus Omnitrophota bacterium]
MTWQGMDRRRFPRANYPCLVIIRRNSMQPEAMLTHTENIGMGGICVILKKDLGLFTPAELEIDLMDTQQHIKCHGKIVWVVKRKNSEEKKPAFFDTGIEFTKVKKEDQERIYFIVQRLVQLQSDNT